MSDLKPCPFCGSSTFTRSVDAGIYPDRFVELATNGDYVTTCTLCCDVCGAQVQGFAESDCVTDDLYATAIESCYAAWNTRADDNEEVVTCLNCGAQIDMLGMFTPLAKSSVLYRHYATYCPACGERLVD